MRDTLLPLIERALPGNPRLLEFYLRDQSRLPGPRANLELVHDVSHLLAIKAQECPEYVQPLLHYLVAEDREEIKSNSPAEFTVLCGIVACGACAAVYPAWREETFGLLAERSESACWRIREGVAMAYQQLLPAAPQETLGQLRRLAAEGSYLQQRAAVAAVAEPALLDGPQVIEAALSIQRQALERLHAAPTAERKREGFRVLRQALGYTLSVVTAAAPEEGFALMRTCASWEDADIATVLRENLKKKRLARFTEHTEALARLLAH
jgi:hypothetical protein